MAFLIGGANSAAETGFSVANSIRFNGDAYLHKQLGTATNNKKCTASLWVKPAVTDSRNTFISGGIDGNNYQKFRTANDSFSFYGNHASSNNLHIECNRKLRDPSAFYHVVIAFDSTQATSTNRIKLYVNGVQETSLNNATYPAEDAICYFNAASTSDIFVGAFGRQDDTIGEQGEGYFAEVCVIDGLALDPTSFGEYSETTPNLWIPKDVSGLTFGNNGFYLDFEDSSNLGNDVNGGTDLTAVSLAAADQATDTPSNNFCTMSPIASLDSPVMSEGNCYMTNDGGSEHAVSTFAASSGRWYFEVKVTVQNSANALVAGISDVYMSQKELAEGWLGMDTGQYGYVGADGKIYHADDGGTSHGDTITTNDILGVYVDLEDNKLYFSKNGTLQNSGTGYSITAPASTTGGAYHFCTGDWYSSTHNVDYGVNFGGCPPFALTSAVSDDNNYGNFEYSPNITGDGSAKKFYAICTKNLAEFG